MRPIPGQHGDTLSSPKNVSDITDSPRDQERLQHEETTIDLPDVEDIPGQENVHVAPLGDLAGTTYSSADEEGAGVLDKDEPNDSDVTPEEVEDLRRSAEVYPSQDEEILQSTGLDSVDNEGDPLNEGSFTGDINMTPDDLDIPGSDLDDADEATGEEDEENNDYSLDEDEEQAETV